MSERTLEVFMDGEHVGLLSMTAEGAQNRKSVGHFTLRMRMMSAAAISTTTIAVGNIHM
jgi:hypothetical protein